MGGISGACLSCWRGDEGEAPRTETSHRLSPVSWSAAGFQLYHQPFWPEGTVSAVHCRLFGGEGAGRQHVQREQSYFYINTGHGGGDKTGVPAHSGGGEHGSSPHLLSLCPGRNGKAGVGRDTAPPPGMMSGSFFFSFFSPQTSFIRPAPTTFPQNPHLTCVLRLPWLQHHCHTCEQGASVCGRGCKGESEPRCTTCRSHLPTETGRAAVTEI